MRSPSRPLLPLLLSVLLGCAARPGAPIDLPPPVEVTSLGEGDVFELHIVGEDKLPDTFTVARDGTADLPYIQRVKVAGLEPQQVAELVRQRLVEEQILTRPSVSVSIKEYNSKRVVVLGEVQRPGSLALEPGMTLLRAISMAGGFTAMANRNKVTVRRKVGETVRVVRISVEDIMSNAIGDVPLQAGDSVNIEQRVF